MLYWIDGIRQYRDAVLQDNADGATDSLGDQLVLAFGEDAKHVQRRIARRSTLEAISQALQYQRATGSAAPPVGSEGSESTDLSTSSEVSGAGASPWESRESSADAGLPLEPRPACPPHADDQKQYEVESFNLLYQRTQLFFCSGEIDCAQCAGPSALSFYDCLSGLEESYWELEEANKEIDSIQSEAKELKCVALLSSVSFPLLLQSPTKLRRANLTSCLSVLHSKDDQIEVP
jgi:hypothetical protein